MDAQRVRENWRTWEAIAGPFDASRRSPWPEVVRFVGDLAPACRVLDAAAGNGRHADTAQSAGHRVVALDLSRGLLVAARRRAPTLAAVQGCLERLPFASASFDAVVCVAAIHHVAPRAQRDEAWAELARVLRPGGALLVSAWARDQPRFDRLQPPDGAGAEPGDALVPWCRGDHRVLRFYHLYSLHELIAEASAAGLAVEKAWTSPGAATPAANHFVAARRQVQ